MGGGRDALFILTNAFRRGWRGATPRLMQAARSLVGHGWTVRLLSDAADVSVREQEDAFPGGIIRTPFRGPYPRLLGRGVLRSLCKRWWRLTGQAHRLEDPCLGWARRVVEFWQRGCFRVPDVLVAVATGGVDAVVAGRFLGQALQRPYVVEFRDPVPFPKKPPLKAAAAEALAGAVAESAHVITTTQAFAEHVEHEHAAVRGKVDCVYMAYEIEAAARTDRAVDAPLVLLHAGHLHGGEGRNVVALVEAMAVAREHAGAERPFELRLLGGGPGAREAKSRARELDIGEAVYALDEVPPDEACRAMQAADVLVVVKFDDPAFDMQIPGKLFQYLGVRKPILGLMRRTEAADILQRSGLGLVAGAADVPAITEALCTLWRERQRLAERFQPDETYIRSFSLARFGEQWDRILRGVCP